MKVLVLIAHPHIEKSRVNAGWKKALLSHSDGSITVHDLYEHYPDEYIDIKHEQKLLLSHDRIVFQFPFYWYSTPPLLKKWMDEVLAFGWAYGPGGSALRGKELILAISIGGAKNSYGADGYNYYTISELTRPLQATANLTGMHFLPHFVLHSAVSADQAEIDKSTEEYIRHIANKELHPFLHLNKQA